MTKTRRFVWLLVALALVALVAVFLRPTPVPVGVARVLRGAMQTSIEEEGMTRIHPRYVVAAPAAGRLAPITLDAGDSVRAGQAVATLYPAPLDARAREQAEASLRAAEAGRAEADAQVAQVATALAQARRDRDRAERLAAAGQVAPADLEQARTAVGTQEEALTAARYRSRAARYTADNARAALLDAESGSALLLHAPADGLVLRLFEESERTVLAGTPVLEIGSPRDLEIVVDVLTGDALAVAPGAAMRVDLGRRVVSGRVRQIEPAAFTKVSPLGVEEQRVHVIGTFDDAPAGVGDRFRVMAKIELWSAPDVVKAPSGAVFRSGDGWAAFVVEGGRARLRAATIGHRNAEEVEILKGLEPGQAVVIYPSDQVRDGARVAALR